ncbi:MAG: hypothetical protein FJX77_12215 [Armatimonadetes bacterium]|nr:hypothetical protein [Armatimonadota bacterium]
MEEGSALEAHALAPEQQPLVRKVLELYARAPMHTATPSVTALHQPILLQFQKPRSDRGFYEVLQRRLAIRWTTRTGGVPSPMDRPLEPDARWGQLALQLDPLDDGTWRPTSASRELLHPKDKWYGQAAPVPEPLRYRQDPRLTAKLELPPAVGPGASGPPDWEMLLRAFEQLTPETVVMQGTWLSKAPQFVARGMTGIQFMAQLEQTARERWEKVNRVWVLTPLSVIARDWAKERDVLEPGVPGGGDADAAAEPVGGTSPVP